jgi:hypothetical protein
MGGQGGTSGLMAIFIVWRSAAGAGSPSVRDTAALPHPRQVNGIPHRAHENSNFKSLNSVVFFSDHRLTALQTGPSRAGACGISLALIWLGARVGSRGLELRLAASSKRWVQGTCPRCLSGRMLRMGCRRRRSRP